MKPNPTQEPASTSHAVLPALERPHGRVGGDHQKEHQQGVGVVVAEHQRRDRGEGQHRAGDQAGRRREPALDRRVEDPDGGHALERLGHEDAPGVEPEDASRQVHDPQRGGRLVDRDEVRGVERPEEERLPGLGPGLHCGRVEGVGPALGARGPRDRGRPSRPGGRAGPGGPRPGPRGGPARSGLGHDPCGRRGSVAGRGRLLLGLDRAAARCGGAMVIVLRLSGRLRSLGPGSTAGTAATGTSERKLGRKTQVRSSQKRASAARPLARVTATSAAASEERP